MVNIFSKVEDLRCTEHWGKEDELKEELSDRFNEFVMDRDIEFTWLSDSHIAVDNEDEYEDIEDEISDMLTDVYDEFIENLEDNEYEGDEE